MTTLSDTQLIILTAATQRADRLALPLPKNLKGGAATKVITSLMAKGLIEEVDAKTGEPVWRATGDGHWVTLAVTDAAFEALGITVDDAPAGATGGDEEVPATNDAPTEGSAPSAPATAAKLDPHSEPLWNEALDAHKVRVAAKAAKAAKVANGASDDAPDRKARTGTKQAQMIDMLRRPDGATIDEIVAITEWQRHTVRGAFAGALKKKLGLDVTSEKIEGRGRVYRIA